MRRTVPRFDKVALLIIDIQLLSNEPENEISLTAFRLLTMDLLILYHVMNEGTINVLGKKFKVKRRLLVADNAKNTTLRCLSLMPREHSLFTRRSANRQTEL